MRAFFFYWTPVLAWAGLIFFFSSIPSLNTGWGLWDFILRKCAHVFVFAVLTTLLLRAFSRTTPDFGPRKIIIWSSVLAFLYAVSDEFHQSFVPGRGPSAVDVAIDTVGILLAVGVFSKMRQSFFRFLYVFPFVLMGCGADYQFEKARELETEGEYSKAWDKYQAFTAKYPSHEKAAESLFRAGWVAQQGLNDCHVATVFYDKVMAEYPQAERWSRAASLQKINCPDYFPLFVGASWESGDSDTKGNIVKKVTKSKPLKYGRDILPSEAGVLQTSYYAGTKKFQTSSLVYRKESNELREYVSEEDSRSKPILKFPLKVGQTWRTRMAGQFFNYEIVSMDESVEVMAGEFSNCLKVRSQIERKSGAQFEYFAPGVGRVLTTLSTPKGEQRHTELLTYKIPDFPGFDKPEKKEDSEEDSKKKDEKN